MKARRRLAMAGAFAALLAAPLHAQAPAATDTTLAGAVATAVADSLLGRVTGGPIVWREGGPLDVEVANALRTHPSLRGPVRDPRHTMWMGIRQIAEHGDTTWVVVQFGEQYRDTGFLTFFEEERAFLFTRAAAGWRFVRSQFLRHADGGPVRG